MDHGAQVIPSPDMQISNDKSKGCYLLHFAVDDGLIDIARLLIDKGKIPINTLDQTGWSPLHIAAGHNYLDIVKLLLENGAEINIKV
jgi:ankyrin repeat protein